MAMVHNQQLSLSEPHYGSVQSCAPIPAKLSKSKTGTMKSSRTLAEDPSNSPLNQNVTSNNQRHSSKKQRRGHGPKASTASVLSVVSALSATSQETTFWKSGGLSDEDEPPVACSDSPPPVLGSNETLAHKSRRKSKTKKRWRSAKKKKIQSSARIPPQIQKSASLLPDSPVRSTQPPTSRAPPNESMDNQDSLMIENQEIRNSSTAHVSGDSLADMRRESDTTLASVPKESLPIQQGICPAAVRFGLRLLLWNSLRTQDEDVTMDERRPRESLPTSPSTISSLAEPHSKHGCSIKDSMLTDLFYKCEWLPSINEHWYATGKCRLGEKKYARLDIKSYFPREFRQHIFHNSQEEMKHMISMFDEDMIVTGAGKSGSTMYWSKNREFIAKTMTSIEVQQAKYQIPRYTSHIAWNPDSLLARCYGMIRVKSGFETTYLLIMRNALYEEPKTSILKTKPKVPKIIYDLKGSMYGRTARGSETIRKDLDFVRAKHRIQFCNSSDYAHFSDQLRRDVEFLKFMCVLDYSLLVSMPLNNGPDDPPFAPSDLRLAIIDFWTPFTSKKKAEHYVMGTLHGRTKISCVPPYLYGERFAEFMGQFSGSLD